MVILDQLHLLLKTIINMHTRLDSKSTFIVNPDSDQYGRCLHCKLGANLWLIDWYNAINLSRVTRRHFSTHHSGPHASDLQCRTAPHLHHGHDVLWREALVAQLYSHLPPNLCYVHSKISSQAHRRAGQNQKEMHVDPKNRTRREVQLTGCLGHGL